MKRILGVFLLSIFSTSIFGTVRQNPPADFDGDGKADISVFRPSDGFWHIKKSSGGFLSVQWGMAGDTPLPEDYDGDGKTDFMVYRGSLGQTPPNTDGVWYLLKSSDNSYISKAFGQNFAFLYSKPVPADYDGDGKADIAVYPESDLIGEGGSFIVLKSSTDMPTVTQWGRNIDTKVSADYDGDGKVDFAVFRTFFSLYPDEVGFWYILQSSTGVMRVERFGSASDKPVPADYDGDGKADIAVYRPSEGTWYRINSRDNSFNATQFGISSDKLVPADYDGDGKTDIAVYRNGIWYLLQSTQGFAAEIFGANGDIPITK